MNSICNTCENYPHFCGQFREICYADKTVKSHKDMLTFQEKLAETYKYKKYDNSDILRVYFEKNLPHWCNVDGDNKTLYSQSGTPICSGYERIVIGDYGAFIEFSLEQALIENFKIKEGQEYRKTDPRYAANVKYLWLTTKDDSDCKIYEQKKTVIYADYKIGKYYISPYECYEK